MFPFTVHDLLECNVTDRADRTAIVLGHESLTYGDLAAHVEAMAAGLVEMGVRRGERVGIHLHRLIEEVVATFAAARVGAVFVNVNYQWTIHQLQYIVDDCDIKTLFTDARKAKMICRAGLLESLDRVIVVGEAPDHEKMVAWANLPTEATVPTFRPIDADLAALLYTSGSTGKPKGVMLTHDNIVQGARSVASYLKNTSDDRVLGLLPMSFDYGMSQVTTIFLVGGTVVLQPVVMPAEIIRALVAQKVTGLAAVPPVWIELVRALQEMKTDLPDLRYVTNSGGKIPPNILEAMAEVFPGVDIFLMYGLTEAFRSTYLDPKLYRKKMGAIGKAIPNVEVFVVDPEKGLCQPNEHGELLHRGSLISRGYWGNPEATDEKIKVCEHLRPFLGDEKVLYSGDTVYRDEDGILWFVGRADAMMKCSGFRVSPTEVEDVVYQASGVGEVVAFGVEDEMLGQAVHVAVASADQTPIDLGRLQQHCRKNMPAYMVPSVVHVWEGRMPRTASGKIDQATVIATCKGKKQGCLLPARPDQRTV